MRTVSRYDVNRKIKALTVGSLALAMVMGAHVAFAQEKSPATNIAVVDMAFVLQNSAAAISLRAQIEKIRASFQQEVNDKQDELDKLDQSLARERPKLLEDAFRQRVRGLRLKVANHQSDVQERQSKLDGAFRGASQKVSAAIEKIVDQIVKERKFSVVLPRASIIGTPAVPDITKEILKRLNKQMVSVAVDIPK